MLAPWRKESGIQEDERKKKRTFNFQNKKLTSATTTTADAATDSIFITDADTNNVTGTQITQNDKTKKRKLTTEIERLSQTDFWGGRAKPQQAEPVFCNDAIGTETCVIIDTEKNNKIYDLEGQSDRGNLIIDYASLKKK